MRFLLGLLVLAVSPAFSAVTDFNGRWDITTTSGSQMRAWWVELAGVGTPAASGKARRIRKIRQRLRRRYE
ncbi:exported hypothetical protein [Candidatus Sulfopaludibacter sp. SbA3]|nr:exported hypothetical protein [Candidatus Sulfopaludibacter sp. SbA3]